MILEAFTFFVALPIALAMVGYAVALAAQSYYRPQRMSATQYVAEMEMLEYGCVCTPGREMETTFGQSCDFTATLEQSRHEMATAIENERHFRELQRIHDRGITKSIADYNRRFAQQPAQRPLQIPQPAKRTVPRLPDSSYVEVSNDGVEWFMVEDNERSEVSK